MKELNKQTKKIIQTIRLCKINKKLLLVKAKSAEPKEHIGGTGQYRKSRTANKNSPFLISSYLDIELMAPGLRNMEQHHR